jgi:hypothetical protein
LFYQQKYSKRVKLNSKNWIFPGNMGAEIANRKDLA